MLGHSSEYADLTKTTHDHIARVRVIQQGSEIRTLNVHAGGVDADRANRYMRTFTASVTDADGDLTPQGIRDLMAPFGTELKLDAGIRVPVTVDVLSRSEDPEDWEAGISFGATTNGMGHLTMQT